MATVKGPEGPEGNPLSSEATIPENTGVEGVGTAGDVPNDDESAQQGEYPAVEGPDSSPSDSGDPTAPANYVATDGDTQGDGRSTQDLKDNRVIDPNAPFDYNTLPDGSDVQGNHYPSGDDFYKAQLARAEEAHVEATLALEDAQAALDAAADAHDANVPKKTEATTGESVLPVNDATTQAVHDNDNSE